MNLTITGHHVPVTKPMRDYTQEKLGALWTRFERIKSIDVYFRVERQQRSSQTPHQAQVVVKVPGHPPIRTEHKCPNMYDAVDALYKKLARILAERINTRDKCHRAQPTGRMDLA